MTDIKQETPAPEPLPVMKFNELFQHRKKNEKEEWWKVIPASPNPFWVLGSDSLFLHRQITIGRGIIPTYKMPEHLGKVGVDFKGDFYYDAPQIPKELCAQIVHFFRRVWENHQTEAEVILTFNPETKEWRPFIPTQKVSSAAVNSVYEPKHILKPWVVVGTMHSHCNFSAFHSGTDTGDADDMDGVHFTIGNVNTKNPSLACMVSLNKKRWDYQAKSCGDFSDLEAATAPEWWDRYVIPTAGLQSNHKPAGYQLFDQYKKPVATVTPSTAPVRPPIWNPPTPYNGVTRRWDAETQAWIDVKPEPTKSTIGDFSRPPIHQPTTNHPSAPSKPNVADMFDDDELAYFRLMGIDPEKDDIGFGWNTESNRIEEDDYWEWNLAKSAGQPFVNRLLDSGLLTEDDFDKAAKDPDSGKRMFWRAMMFAKLNDVEDILADLGIEVKHSLTIKAWVLREQNDSNKRERKPRRKKGDPEPVRERKPRTQRPSRRGLSTISASEAESKDMEDIKDKSFIEQPHDHPLPGPLDGKGNCPGCASYSLDKNGTNDPDKGVIVDSEEAASELMAPASELPPGNIVWCGMCEAEMTVDSYRRHYWHCKQDHLDFRQSPGHPRMKQLGMMLITDGKATSEKGKLN